MLVMTKMYGKFEEEAMTMTLLLLWFFLSLCSRDSSGNTCLHYMSVMPTTHEKFEEKTVAVTLTLWKYIFVNIV